MKDFDALRSEREQRERSFRIAGRDFRFRAAIPAETYSLYLELMGKMAEGQWPEGSFDVLNATMLELLEPDEHEAWAAALASGNGNPVSFEDIGQIIDYCVSVQTDRPTVPRSPSTPTDESGSTTSTDVSGSRVAQASPSST